MKGMMDRTEKEGAGGGSIGDNKVLGVLNCHLHVLLVSQSCAT